MLSSLSEKLGQSKVQIIELALKPLHGMQRHAHPKFERIRELILDGATGDLRRFHRWDSGGLRRAVFVPAVCEKCDPQPATVEAMKLDG